ncbi:hypothetical protein T4C_5887 [Trichinella pseudospiralis]|uniref:Uncharacterized protein n=1 Tax=Trichinella pseudospiralis TaxID=6337 RepID=A0A0V1GJN8_TRIPS|nr:hypothetical protein T4C_5887 [Trichinella pseudospiralis]
MIYNHFQYHLGDSHSQQHVHPLTLIIFAMLLDDDPMAAETHLIWMIDNYFQYQVGDSHSQQHVHPMTLLIYRCYGSTGYWSRLENDRHQKEHSLTTSNEF